jgi:hypothetical protein
MRFKVTSAGPGAFQGTGPANGTRDRLLTEGHFTAIVALVSAWIVPFSAIAGEIENAPGATFTGT